MRRLTGGGLTACIDIWYNRVERWERDMVSFLHPLLLRDRRRHGFTPFHRDGAVLYHQQRHIRSDS